MDLKDRQMLPIRIGLIGCGIVTTKAHLPAIIRDSRFQISALCRRDIEKLQYLKNQFPHAKCFSDAKELIESDLVDCVLVAADVAVHLSIAQMALDNDLYALIEKPVDSSSIRISKFVNRNSGKLNKLMVAFNKRFNPGIIKFDELVNSKRLANIIGGTILFITKQGGKRGKAGVLQNLIHTCDLACHIFGKPKDVYAHFSALSNDDYKGKTISVTLHTEKGCAVNLFFTSCSNWQIPVHERIEVFDYSKSKLLIEDADRVIFSQHQEGGIVTNSTFRQSNSIFWRYNSFGYEAQISKFGDLINKQYTNSSPSINDALNAHVLFEQIFEFDKR